MYQKKPIEKSLPTMYDLPSENPEDPGLPDEYHIFQPLLLRKTFQPPNYPQDKVFIGTDINLYYDTNNTKWYKRPDWFAVVGVDQLYNKEELRLSYVTWDEQVNPFIVIELLSPGTEKEDLGKNIRDSKNPPTKWQVYEQILKIPYYLVYNRYKNQLTVFQLNQGYYEELTINGNQIWFEEIQLYLGRWQGKYENVTREWLRWYDKDGKLILNPEEKAEKLAAQLRALGIQPEE